MIDDEIRSTFSKYRHKGILIDTNILLLYFIGTVNKERITKFSPTEKFIPEDYDTLLTVMQYFSKRVTTPNILTEVNSFTNKLREPERSKCYTLFSQSLSIFDEFYVSSEAISKITEFPSFGLTDCSICDIAQNQYLVLTDDFKLTGYLSGKGVDVINFNHLRVYGWS